MSSLDEIQSLLENILEELPALIHQAKISPHQIVIVTGLSDFTERMGLVQSGEFRTGNSKEPGFGFTGVRQAYPAMSYAGDTWHFVGVNNDVLQFGLNAEDGKAYFAAGADIIDVNGLTLRAVEYPSETAHIRWKDTNGVIIGEIISQYVSGVATNTWMRSRIRTAGEDSFVTIMAADTSGAMMTQLIVQSDGDAALDLRLASKDGAGNQAFNIQVDVTPANSSHQILYLDTNTKGTPANGLGTAMVLRAENSNHEMTSIGVISAEYTDVTDGTEDSKIVAYYMVNGVITSKQLAP